MRSFAAALLLSLSPGALAAMRGLAYNNATLANYFTQFPTISWAYNWDYQSSGLDPSFEYVPMLWGDPTNDPNYQQEWAAAASSASTTGSTCLLAFNEPDLSGFSPAAAATAYMTYMQPYAGQYRLGAPAVTNGADPLGLTWLEQFLGNCTACTVDFVPIHWYDNWDNIAYFSDYIPQAYAAGGNRPIWITEFQGLNGDDGQQIQFLETVLPWLDSLDYVERYSYFGVFTDILITDDGTAVSDIGQEYGTSTNVNSTTPTTVL